MAFMSLKKHNEHNNGENISSYIEFLESTKDKYKHRLQISSNLNEKSKMMEEIEKIEAIEAIIRKSYHGLLDELSESELDRISKEYLNTYEELKSFMETKLAYLEEKMNGIKAAIGNSDSVKKFLQIEACGEGKEESETLRVILSRTKKLNANNSVQEEQKMLDLSIKKLENLIALIDVVLNDSSYKDFRILSARKEMQTSNLKESVFPISESESRRLKQFEILINTIKRLNKIKKKVEALNRSHNILKNITGENKQAKDKLLFEYNKICRECYEELKEKDLLFVLVSRSYFERENEIFLRPQDFRGIFTTNQTPRYEINEENYLELAECHAIPASFTLEELNKRLQEHYYLSENFFKGEDTADGMIEFSLDDAEMEELLSFQNFIASAYDKLYKREVDINEKNSSLALESLSDEMKKIIKIIGVAESVVTRDYLMEERVMLFKKLNRLKSERKELLYSFDSKNVCGNVTLKDALEYVQLLDGFYEIASPEGELDKLKSQAKDLYKKL